MDFFNKSSSSSSSSSSSPADMFKSIATTTPGASEDFLSSQNAIAKVTFILLLLLAFIVLLRIGVLLISYLTKPDDSPELITGMIDASSTPMTFAQDPAVVGAKTIYRSKNQDAGVEFTWSVWIYIKDVNEYKDEKYRTVFYKGDHEIPATDSTDKTDLNFPNNAPGLYIAPYTNKLVVMMSTYTAINDEIEIPDIPLNKWINVIIRCKNKTLDVYINGTITRSVELSGIPKQNYGDVFVATNGGFNGNISNLWYYNYAIGSAAIQKISKAGPNITMTGNTGPAVKTSDYLSMRWFFYGTGDGFNP